ncbi:MAG: MarR family transcriptional regulator [Candidatus Saccharibacteria bacterium]
MNMPINVGREVNIFINKVNRRISESVAVHGITGPQAHILNFVFNKSSESDVLQKDIEKEFDIRRSTTTNALQIMEKRGLIIRKSVDTDTRLKRVILTEKGNEIQKEVSSIIYQSEKALREALTENEFNSLIEIIKKLSNVRI